MRIIAGSRKGARIFAPKGRDTRPTADRVREAAFNLLGPGAAEDAKVLDLFAGSGAMGLEALSRGAAHVTFVESDREACRTIVRNLDKLVLENATVLCQDALTALRADARAATRYDLVLLDPANRSSTFASSAAPGPSRLNAASRTRSAVGRVSRPFGAKMRAPLCEPAMIRTLLDPIGERRMTFAVQAAKRPLRFLPYRPPTLQQCVVGEQPLQPRTRFL